MANSHTNSNGMECIERTTIVSQPTERKFPPPRIMRVLSVVQVMFAHKETNRHFLTKIDVSKLNQKLQRLQEEGMTVLGIFLTDVDKDPTVNFMATQQEHPTGGGE